MPTSILFIKLSKNVGIKLSSGTFLTFLHFVIPSKKSFRGKIFYSKAYRNAKFLKTRINRWKSGDFCLNGGFIYYGHFACLISYWGSWITVDIYSFLVRKNH